MNDTRGFAAASRTTRIHVGVGGWTYEPWRDNFYPKGLAHAQELHYASRQLTAIEINGTFYSTFKPASFAKWRDETPEGFMFSVKAHRFATHRKQLAGAGEAVQHFVNSGIAQLREKLGPVVWQLMPTTRFDAADLNAFLDLLPRELEGRALRHVLDVRHASFACEEYLALIRQHGCTTVHTDSPKFPNIADEQSDLAYLRLMRSAADCASGYPPEQLAPWAEGARAWIDRSPRHEAYVYFINGAKERAPAAAMQLLRQLAAESVAI